MRLCYRKDYASIIGWIEEMGKSSGGREKFKRFFGYALRASRYCLILNNIQNNNDILKLTPEEHEFFLKFYPFINKNNIDSITEEFNNALFHTERNVNPKAILMDTSFKLMRLFKA